MKSETQPIGIPGAKAAFDHDDGWDSNETLTFGTPSTPNVIEVSNWPRRSWHVRKKTLGWTLPRAPNTDQAPNNSINNGADADGGGNGQTAPPWSELVVIGGGGLEAEMARRRVRRRKKRLLGSSLLIATFKDTYKLTNRVERMDLNFANTYRPKCGCWSY